MPISLSPSPWRRQRIIAHIAVACCVIGSATIAMANPPYPWPHQKGATAKLADHITPPAGFIRTPARTGSFAHWLRALPMKPRGTAVLLHDGRRKWRQDVHAGVIDIDTGKRDLQQCADAVMRLRAEFLRAAGRAGDIAFNETGAARPMSYSRWAEGARPRLSGNRLRWSRRAKADAGYASFRKYMTIVFAYAGTYSLAKELAPVTLSKLRIGDVFIKGGFPGHAVLVADMVEHPSTGEKRFALIQSFMPAQDMHVLKNPATPGGSPWYPANFDGALTTPEWTFPAGSLKRWK